MDGELLERLDFPRAIGRIKNDIVSDFILAPHYSIIYEHADVELIERLSTLLRNGAYSPRNPLNKR